MNKATESFTISQGDELFTYDLTHSDGRIVKVETDWQFPAIASLLGWNPCMNCQQDCRYETDGTIGCVALSAFDHILDAQIYLDRCIGQHIPDTNHVFDYLVEDNDAN